MVSHTRSQKSSEITDSKQKTRPDPTGDPANRNGRLTRVVVVIEKPEAHRRTAKPQAATASRAQAKGQRLAAIRIAEINRVLEHCWSGRADRGDVRAIVESIAFEFSQIEGWPRNFQLWLRKLAPTITPDEAATLTSIADEQTEPFCPVAAGKILRLSEVDRVRLGIRMIKPCDLTPVEAELSRRETKRLKDQARRRAQGAKARAESASRRRPWEAEGISRRTWERRRSRDDDANTSETYSIKHSYVRREFASRDAPPISLWHGGALEARPPKVLSRTEGRAALFAAAIRALDVSLIPRAA